MKKMLVILLVISFVFGSTSMVFATENKSYPYAANDIYGLAMQTGDQIHLFSNHNIIVSGKFNGNKEEVIMVVTKYVTTHVTFDDNGGMIWGASETLSSVRKQLGMNGKYLKTIYKRISDQNDHCLASSFPGSNLKLASEKYLEPSTSINLPKGTIIRAGSVYIGNETFIAAADNDGKNNCQPVKVIQLTTDETVYLPYGGFISTPDINLDDLLNQINKLGWEQNYLDIITY